MRFARLLSALIMSAAFVLPVPAQQAADADPEALRRQLETLQMEIRDFQNMLEQTRDARSDLEDKLKANEKRISELLKKIEEIEKEIREGEQNISRSKKERDELELARVQQQEHIARQIRAAWEIGNQGYLKVLLNQEDPHQIARMLTYYDYFNRARAERIEKYSETIAALRQVEDRIVRQNEALIADRQDLEARSRALVDARAEKEEALAALNRQIAETGSEMEKRLADRERLEALLETIIRGIANIPTPGDTAPFSTRKGELLLPVAGKITDKFGASRNAGSLRWNGLFIEATAGDPVHAVHYGRVVFSDWLRGFGLLLIINHGDGYMSLYGHNEVLYRETGDWVSAGDVIATVGNSGGQNRSGVYFEIRHAGKPTDPQLWCQARSSRSA